MSVHSHPRCNVWLCIHTQNVHIHLHARIYLSNLDRSLTRSSGRSDPSGELRIDRSGIERQQPLRLLLPGGPAGLVPGAGHAGHRQSYGLELRVHLGLRGKLRRERSGRLRADLKRGRSDGYSLSTVMLLVHSQTQIRETSVFRMTYIDVN